MAATYLELIVKKRDGEILSAEEIERLVGAIASREMPDHQVGALLMAIYLRGLSPQETADLTMSMVSSGETVDLSGVPGFKADKHSTGGVGDKVSLILGPLVASAGVKFPKLSGRGLAHTGGTLDKLESIPGLRVDLSMERFIEQVCAIGLAITGQTRELVPADGAIYALRDQTGTVGSIPLIASSVMSKKIAAGADGIVLDVKCGRGAFMKTLDDARELARRMVEIGRSAGKETRAIITSMEVPLGFAVGNALEVREAIDTLHGHGPADLEEEVLALAAEILHMAGKAADSETARKTLHSHLGDGTAAEKLRQMILWQGGDAGVVGNPNLLPRATEVIQVESPTEGHVHGIDALEIGIVAMELGAGRKSKDDKVAPAAGIVLRAKPGPETGFVTRGAILADLHLEPRQRGQQSIPSLKRRVQEAYTLGPEPRERQGSVLATLN